MVKERERKGRKEGRNTNGGLYIQMKRKKKKWVFHEMECSIEYRVMVEWMELE